MTAAPVHARAFLVCDTDGRRCALALEHVVETMRPLPISPFAGAPDFVLGVAIVRGAPTPVVDLAALLGGGRRTPGRFVTVKAGERRVALAVERVAGVHMLPAADGVIPPLLREARADVVAGVSTLDAELLVVIRAARIVPDEVWHALTKQAADA